MSDFIAKKENLTTPDICFDEFIITLLKDLVDGDRDKVHLSLVQLVKCCLSRIAVLSYL